MEFNLPFYKAPVEGLPASPEYPAVSLPAHARPMPTTTLGTIWVGRVEIGSATDFEGRSLEAFSLPEATLTDVSLTRNVVTTQLAGGHGTVKELASSEDYQVRMRGLSTNLGSLDLPEDFLQSLAALAALKSAVPVTSDLLVQFGITSLVITSLAVTSLEGRPNTVQFELSALADASPEATIMSRGAAR